MYLFASIQTATVLVVATYLIAVFLAWKRADVARQAGLRSVEARMLLLAFLLSFLALSYQLEFIAHGIGWVKSMAKEQGWYVYRWPLAILAVGLVVLFVTMGCMWMRRKTWRFHFSQVFFAIGVVVLAGYFLLRATSIHWVDPWIGIHLGCPRTNPWIQIMAVGLLVLGFWFAPAIVSSSQTPAVAEALPNKQPAVRLR